MWVFFFCVRETPKKSFPSHVLLSLSHVIGIRRILFDVVVTSVECIRGCNKSERLIPQAPPSSAALSADFVGRTAATVCGSHPRTALPLGIDGCHYSPHTTTSPQNLLYAFSSCIIHDF